MLKDEIIIKRYLNGKDVDINILIEKYYKDIYKYVYLRLFDKDYSMDLTQEIFISFFKNIDSFDYKKGSLKNWLYSIAKNKCIDFFRSNYSKETLSYISLDNLEPILEIDMENNLENKEILEEINNILDKQDQILKKIYDLKINKSVSFKEIALEVGLNENTVKTRFYRFINILKKEVMK